MNYKDLSIFVCLLVVLMVSIASAAPVQVTVSILPEKYFVERIAGKTGNVSVMVPPGSNPATYEPRPRQMRALVHSRIYFAIGVPFERTWLQKIIAINPEMQIVHLDKNIKKRRMATRRDSLPPTEGGLDPHIWLAPSLVKIQAREIAKALIRNDPSQKGLYEKNLGLFEIDLDRLDMEIRKIFAHKGKGAQFLVFHPSWGYFAEEYGLKQIPIEVEGKEPGPKQMASIIRYAKSKGIRVIFVQPEFSTRGAETIAKEINGRIVVADPLREDWMENLREVAMKFDAATLSTWSE